MLTIITLIAFIADMKYKSIIERIWREELLFLLVIFLCDVITFTAGFWLLT